MPKLFGKTVTKLQILSTTGDISQVCGLSRYLIAEGPGKGVEGVEIRTGSGLDFKALLDRGMDITQATFRGVPLAWRSPSGECHPSRFDDKGLGWLRTFPGGLVATCGLIQTGAPSRDRGEDLGLHGRYTSLPASNVSQSAGWEESDYVMRLSGEMREAVLFGENLVLHREISAKLGEPGFVLSDRVTNEGPRTTPLMILYHCNFGFPLLDQETILKTPHTHIEPRDEEAADGLEEACRFDRSRSGYREKVYFHHLKPDRLGYVTIRLTNPNLLGGLTLSMRYRLDQLPYFTQWKMLGKREYVCGLEPGNALVLGRAGERKAGRLDSLKPGESRSFEIAFSLSSDA